MRYATSRKPVGYRGNRRVARRRGGVGNRARTGEPPTPPGAVSAYLRHLEVERRVSGHTLEAYRRDLGRLAAFAGARNRSLEQLTRADLDALVRDMMTSGLSATSTARLVAAV